MQWHTPVPQPNWQLQARVQDRWLLLGSCFVENLYNHMQFMGERVWCNPFGIIYHPFPMADVLLFKKFDAAHIVQRPDGLVAHLQTHGKLAASDKQSLINTLQDISEKLKAHLETCQHIVLTLGTAWGYYHKEAEIVVANCHKLPQQHFQKQLTETATIVHRLEKAIQYVENTFGPKNWIFTLSPVRHIRDGMEQNQVSKSILRHTLWLLTQGKQRRYYFPAYEIMMDELRDYRFYATDRIHPSEEALEYIWERWKQVAFDAKAQAMLQEAHKLRLRLAHKTRFSDTHESRQHHAETDLLLKQFQQKYGLAYPIWPTVSTQ